MIQDKPLLQQNVSDHIVSSLRANNQQLSSFSLSPGTPDVLVLNSVKGVTNSTIKNVKAPIVLAETTVIELEDSGPGHAALHIDDDGTGNEFLYDPAGSYSPPNQPRGGDLFSGSAANLDNYKRYWESKGDTVNLHKLNTSPQQEQEIIQRAENIGTTMGGFCASSVSGALGGVCEIEGSMWPSTLGDNASNATCD